MDKYELRRLALLDILATQCGGNAASLAARIGKDASYVHRMLYPEGKAGRKRIGEDMAELIGSTFSVQMALSGLKLVPNTGGQRAEDFRDSDAIIELLALWQAANLEGRQFILDSAREAPQRIASRWVKSGD